MPTACFSRKGLFEAKSRKSWAAVVRRPSAADVVPSAQRTVCAPPVASTMMP
jgi:hypothetical protein